MKADIDATVLIALGTVGELDQLTVFDADPVVLPAVREEVTSEPAKTALDQAIEAETLILDSTPPTQRLQEASNILHEPTDVADVHLIGAVLEDRNAERQPAVVSDDRRVRTVARGLGATVTGTIGVVIRAAEEGLDPESATALIRRLDEHGLHMTARLRERAEELIEDAGR